MLIHKIREFLWDFAVVLVVVSCFCFGFVTKLVGSCGASLCDSLASTREAHVDSVTQLLLIPVMCVVLFALVLFSCVEAFLEYLLVRPVEK